MKIVKYIITGALICACSDDSSQVQANSNVEMPKLVEIQTESNLKSTEINMKLTDENISLYSLNNNQLSITLDTKATNKLSYITQNNIGEKLKITWRSYIITSSSIFSAVDSGNIVSISPTNELMDSLRLHIPDKEYIIPVQ